PFRVRTDFLRITSGSILVPITVAVQKQDLAFELEEGIYRSVVNIFGRVTTLTGRIVQTFEDVIQLDTPPALLQQTLHQSAVYQKAIPLPPGLYKLNLVLKDLRSGDIGTLEQRLPVPRFEEDSLAHSSLILADLLERVSSRNVGSGQFVIGTTKLRPAVDEEFTPGERLGVYLQVYNLAIDEETQKPEASIS
ncbi:MAG: GWxTD domain-containing protein, partial [Anaerolineae bacterium]|nr:GWxTD domain-containing protein [Anaerolineae bacterium]